MANPDWNTLMKIEALSYSTASEEYKEQEMGTYNIYPDAVHAHTVIYAIKLLSLIGNNLATDTSEFFLYRIQCLTNSGVEKYKHAVYFTIRSGVGKVFFNNCGGSGYSGLYTLSLNNWYYIKVTWYGGYIKVRMSDDCNFVTNIYSSSNTLADSSWGYIRNVVMVASRTTSPHFMSALIIPPYIQYVSADLPRLIDYDSGGYFLIGHSIFNNATKVHLISTNNKCEFIMSMITGRTIIDEMNLDVLDQDADYVIEKLDAPISDVITDVNEAVDMAEDAKDEAIAAKNEGVTLNTKLTLTRAGYLDFINNLNTRLTDARATIIDNVNTRLTDVRAGYLDFVNNLNTRLTDVRAGYLDNLNTRLTDTRAGKLDLMDLIKGATDLIPDLPDLSSIVGGVPQVSDIQNGLALGADLLTVLGRLTSTRSDFLDKLNITGLVAGATDLASLLSRLSVTRADFLDKLNITGLVAGATDVNTMLSRLSDVRSGYLDYLNDLNTRLSSVRGGYLDKLNITGLVAGATDVASLLTRLSVVRADYLDKLNITGLVAGATEVATLLTRLSSTRATLLDKLDITGMIAGATDLTTLLGRLTLSRAGYLDYLNTINTRITGTLPLIADIAELIPSLDDTAEAVVDELIDRAGDIPILSQILGVCNDIKSAVDLIKVVTDTIIGDISGFINDARDVVTGAISVLSSDILNAIGNLDLIGLIGDYSLFEDLIDLVVPFLKQFFENRSEDVVKFFRYILTLISKTKIEM